MSIRKRTPESTAPQATTPSTNPKLSFNFQHIFEAQEREQRLRASLPADRLLTPEQFEEEVIRQLSVDARPGRVTNSSSAQVRNARNAMRLLPTTVSLTFDEAQKVVAEMKRRYAETKKPDHWTRLKGEELSRRLIADYKRKFDKKVWAGIQEGNNSDRVISAGTGANFHAKIYIDAVEKPAVKPAEQPDENPAESTDGQAAKEAKIRVYVQAAPLEDDANKEVKQAMDKFQSEVERSMGTYDQLKFQDYKFITQTIDALIKVATERVYNAYVNARNSVQPTP